MENLDIFRTEYLHNVEMWIVWRTKISLAEIRMPNKAKGSSSVPRAAARRLMSVILYIPQNGKNHIFSLKRIGTYVGDRDHSTIISMMREHKKIIDAPNPHVEIRYRLQFLRALKKFLPYILKKGFSADCDLLEAKECNIYLRESGYFLKRWSTSEYFAVARDVISELTEVSSNNFLSRNISRKNVFCRTLLAAVCYMFVWVGKSREQKITSQHVFPQREIVNYFTQDARGIEKDYAVNGLIKNHKNIMMSPLSDELLGGYREVFYRAVKILAPLGTVYGFVVDPEIVMVNPCDVRSTRDHEVISPDVREFIFSLWV